MKEKLNDPNTVLRSRIKPTKKNRLVEEELNIIDIEDVYSDSALECIDSLLIGRDLLFCYENLRESSKLYKLVVVRDFCRKSDTDMNYGYGIITKEESIIAPEVGVDRLEEIYKELVACHVDQKILTLFRSIIENETISN